MVIVRSSVLCQITAFGSKTFLRSSRLFVAAALTSLRANALIVACIADSLISRTPGDLGYEYQLRDKLSGGVCQRRSARVRRPSAANQPTSAKRSVSGTPCYCLANYTLG